MDVTDDIYGMNSDNAKNGSSKQEGFRVVYHKKVNYAVSEEDIKELGMPLSNDEGVEESPIWGEYGLNIELKETYIGMDDYRFNEYFYKAAKNVGWNVNENQGYYNQFSESAMDFLYDELNNTGHWMLGYPHFTQHDPREYDENLNKGYDIQLLQIDSDYGDDDYIMWGDSGVANFFINEKDLENEDFGDVLYWWDCC